MSDNNHLVQKLEAATHGEVVVFSDDEVYAIGRELWNEDNTTLARLIALIPELSMREDCDMPLIQVIGLHFSDIALEVLDEDPGAFDQRDNAHGSQAWKTRLWHLIQASEAVALRVLFDEDLRDRHVTPDYTAGQWVVVHSEDVAIYQAAFGGEIVSMWVDFPEVQEVKRLREAGDMAGLCRFLAAEHPDTAERLLEHTDFPQLVGSAGMAAFLASDDMGLRSVAASAARKLKGPKRSDPGKEPRR